MEEALRRIEYAQKEKINLTQENASDKARETIDNAKEGDVLVLRVRVNSPVYIEAAALLTSEGIREVCRV